MEPNKADTIAYLEYLTNKLPRIPLHLVGAVASSVDLCMTEGICEAINLFNNEEVAIALCDMKADSISPVHSHGEREWLIVFSGSIEVYSPDIEIAGIHRFDCYDNDVAILNAGDYIFIPIGLRHEIRSNDGARFIAITIPSDPAFPRNDN